MKDTENVSHFDLVRQQNRRLVRNLMRGFKQSGKAELAAAAGLSFPTVSALLGDLCRSGEVLLLPATATRGGRPAEQFALNPAFQAAVCAYIEDHRLYIQVYDALGQPELFEEVQLSKSGTVRDILEAFARVREKYPSLSVICLGVPGSVSSGKLIYIPDYDDLQGVDLRTALEEETGVRVFIENDVNVIAASERAIWPDLIHLYNGANGPGAGILISGVLLRGAFGLAGELEYFPIVRGRIPINFRQMLALIKKQAAEGKSDRTELLACLADVIAGIICLINPADAALSGFGLSEDDMDGLRREITRRVPPDRCPVLHLVDDVEATFRRGLWEIAFDYWKSI